MKKIKKLLTIGLTFLLCFTAFTACNLYKENLWFSEEKLQKCLVSDLPKLNSDKYVRYNDNDIYAKLTEEEFHSYANEIYEYLLESNFEYLGTRGAKKSSLNGAFPVYYFKPATELSGFLDGREYCFVYSDGNITNGNGDLTFCIIMLTQYSSTKTIEYDKYKTFDYNSLISLRFNSEEPLGGRYELHEHTYEWVGSEGGHQKVYTCGCASPDIAELHRDNDGDYKCDVCDWLMDETLPEEAYFLIQTYEEKYPQAGKANILRYCGMYESGAIVAMLAGSNEDFDCALWTETVAGYDFNYSDGNRILVLYGDEFYTLTKAYENGYLTKENIADIHIKWDGELPEIVPQSYFEIIDELQMSDIQRIETVEYAGSIAPNIRKPIEYKTSTLAADVETVYTWLKSLQGTLTKIADEEAQLAGAGTKIFTIYTSQNYFTISDVGRNYLNIGDGFYEQEGETPEIVGETVTYKFESYYDEAELYINDEKVKDYTFNFEQLVCIEKDFETSGNPYKLVASIGSLYLYDEKHFIRNDIKYEIVGTVDFSQIFDDFPTNDSNDILYIASYPQDFEYNGRHYRLVQGVGLKTTVTQEELGELLGYIIREEDVSAFTQEYPNVDYVIDNSIYDYDTNNRVAFYSVKAYPDLSLICMHQLGDYVLFQDITDLLA